MKNIVCTGDCGISLLDTPVPEKADDEAMIEIKACGLCGSELPDYRHPSPEDGPAQWRTGHESAGVVTEPGTSGLLKKGDRVVLCDVAGCGECEHCRTGHDNFCSVMPGGKRAVHPGGHAEQVSFVERACLKIPDSMTFETAIAVGGCGIGVAWHGIKRLDIQKDENVMIIGAGPIGLAAAMLVRHLGGIPIVNDISEYRLGLAAECGAEMIIDGKEDSDLILSKLKNMKINNTILCTGNHDAAKLGLSCLQPLGKMLILGGLSNFALTSFTMMGIGDKSLVGSWHYHRCEWDEMMQMVAEGLPAHKLVTHVFKFDEAEEAYRVFASGDTGKVILQP